MSTELEKYERGNTIKLDADFKLSGALTDPYNNAVTLDVIKPDGTYLYSAATATRDGTGEYHYFISTNSLDPLGIYYAVWKGQHDVGGAQGRMPIKQRDPFELREID